ncbi:hypothetical protein GCM10025872_18780 [Barrientosiimonas endolithica]|uniref:ABC transporter domain-containing protein n=1 Tax=Barrientosiimonas endolithica TaxID=1535208 RepID=A0ABN6YM43_9MICO|nr:ATP-binding cassette domain-containing protein [Barrientosiimonas endolithica]BDZ58221.1 hypothetical protein GCM10025872_18780 [Barrientosiimonas endolithica]
MTATTEPTYGAPGDGTSGELILDASGVVMRFGGLVAVGGVDLQVHQGEIVGLIGPNGAGKTTFFNCLTGMYRPTEGTVRFEGRCCRPSPARWCAPAWPARSRTSGSSAT